MARPVAPRAAASGNVLLGTAAAGRPKESLAHTSRIVALDRTLLSERVGRLARRLDLVLAGIDVVLER
jgi:hypothetical protein